MTKFLHHELRAEQYLVVARSVEVPRTAVRDLRGWVASLRSDAPMTMEQRRARSRRFRRLTQLYWHPFKPYLMQYSVIARLARLYRRPIWRHARSKLAQWWDELHWVTRPEGQWHVQRLAALRDKYAGRRCFIIGNGPSLNEIDMRKLKDEVTIGCNGLFMIFDKIGFQPTFYTVEDWLVAEDRAHELNTRVTDSTKVFPRDLAYCLRFDDKTAAVNFVRQYDGSTVGLFRFTEQFESRAFFGGTVSFLNLQLAYHIGCREIYLVGFDHTYQVPTSVDVEGFEFTSRESDVNHFHPDYFGPGKRWHDPNVPRMEQAYRITRSFFAARGVQIYNATKGGKLEVFPRVDFDQLF